MILPATQISARASVLRAKAPPLLIARYGSAMAHRMTTVVGTAVVALGLVGAAAACSANSDESLNPAAAAVADLQTVTDFSFDGDSEGCAFDPERGGLVYKGLTIKSKSTGVLKLSFYVQRDSLDDILPGYVSTVFVFDQGSRSHTFDLVLPVAQDDYAAGYDECRWHVGGG